MTTVITVARKVKRRYRQAGTFTRRAPAGRSTIELGRKRLEPGLYRATIVVTGDGTAGNRAAGGVPDHAAPICRDNRP